jgi:uncharacterized BrkB/YihY/UPF0761 family membrane protein
MIKRRRFNFRIGSRFPRIQVRRLCCYWHGGIWKDIWQHVGKLNMSATAMEATFLLSLGLTAGSFALLQSNLQGMTLPAATFTLSFSVAEVLGLRAENVEADVNRLWVGLILGIAWLCLVGGVSRLSTLTAQVYRSSLPKRRWWMMVLYHWFLTAWVLAIASLALYWVGPDYLIPQAAVDLRLQTAEGSQVPAQWQATVWNLLRWPLTLTMVGLGLGLFYRLSPQRWQRGAPIWPGVGLGLALGGMGLGLGGWGIHQITAQALAFGLLLVVAIAMVTLLWLALSIALGAQFNVSLVNLHQVSMPAVLNRSLTTAPPPSFDSFKINRGPGDHIRGE